MRVSVVSKSVSPPQKVRNMLHIVHDFVKLTMIVIVGNDFTIEELD